MNFFEVKIGRTSRRGNFESFNSFVAKTEMDYSQLYSELKDRYKGFEVSIKTVETIEEFKKENVVVEKEKVYNPIKSPTNYLKLDESKSKLTEYLENLRLELEIKEREFDNLESEFRAELSRHLLKKHSNIANGVQNIKKTYQYYSEFEYELRLKGDLKTLLENEKESK